MKVAPNAMWLFVQVSKVVFSSNFFQGAGRWKWSQIGVAFWMLWFSLGACFFRFWVKKKWKCYKGRILFLLLLAHSCVWRPYMEVLSFLDGLAHDTPKWVCGNWNVGCKRFSDQDCGVLTWHHEPSGWWWGYRVLSI